MGPSQLRGDRGTLGDDALVRSSPSVSPPGEISVLGPLSLLAPFLGAGAVDPWNIHIPGAEVPRGYVGLP